MASQLQPLPPWLDLDERVVERWPLDIPASLVSQIYPDKVDVRLRNIATHGCLIIIAGGIGLGRYVTITLPRAITVEGWIAWSKGENAGLDFVRPLPLSLVELVAGDSAT